MKVGSLFSGIGGFDLGLERAGFKLSWMCEKDQFAKEVLSRHWPDTHIHRDVHDVRESSVDIICGGFPCQDYSVAGGREGLAGDRGALWWEMHRVIAECRPEWVVAENVFGLLTNNGGRDFLEIVRSLVELGYGISWSVIDSKYHGVPQQRRRLFIIGHSGGIPRPEILAISEGMFGNTKPYQRQECFSGGSESSFGEEQRRGWTCMSSGQSKAEIKTDLAPTLNLNKDGAPIVFHPESSGPRRMTPIECERLQGFPDDWTKLREDGVQIGDHARYRLLGNAVTVNVAEWIGRRITNA